jgi:hypothetical protein
MDKYEFQKYRVELINGYYIRPSWPNFYEIKTTENLLFEYPSPIDLDCYAEAFRITVLGRESVGVGDWCLNNAIPLRFLYG